MNQIFGFSRDAGGGLNERPLFHLDCCDLLAEDAFGNYQDLFNNGDLSLIVNVGTLSRLITKRELLKPVRTTPRPVSLGGHNTRAAYWQVDGSNRIDTTQDGCEMVWRA